TRLDVALDGDRYRWISNRGIGRPGSAIILPAGEVATFPAAVEGTLVADVAFNVNTPFAGDVRLAASPVTVTVVKGRAVEMRCADRAIEGFVRRCLEMPDGNRVGELGFGTNFAITTPVAANSHINERFPGIHLGFGQHNQGPTVDYRSERHLDLIARGGLVWVDDQPEPLDLSALASSSLPHPDCTRDEDAFAPAATLDSDCCGLDPEGTPACAIASASGSPQRH
ncbi:MAG: hypothetical protein IT561_10805, partial [Alphaproteobacteria bacterium]|nr:hypothetical protein [Alphaproteobacteria bacterium]